MRAKLLPRPELAPLVRAAARALRERRSELNENQGLAVADARERQECERYRARGCQVWGRHHFDSRGGDQWVWVRDDGTEHNRFPLRERRARVNNDLWLHGDSIEERPTRDFPWMLCLVGLGIAVTLGALYVLSCGLGMCAI